jgi:cysteine desulfurase
MIYLDNNATTPVLPEVLEAMLPYFTRLYGNPSSTHRLGQQSRQAVEQARYQLANLVGCQPREIIFTSGGTEATSTALYGLLAGKTSPGTILTTTVEHSATGEPLTQLAKQGYQVRTLGVDAQGRLDLAAWQSALAQPGVVLVTLIWANNETGVIADVASVASLAREAGVPVHVDAVQMVGKAPVDFAALGVTAMSLSGHKFHAPKGVGALIVQRNSVWSPWLRGGPQERQRRGGTENVAGIVGLGKAAELAQWRLTDPAAWPVVAGRRAAFEQAVLAAVPDSYIMGAAAPRLPNTTNIAFAGAQAEALLLLLSEHDICASAGAACASGSLEPSHVIKAMGLPDAIAQGALRFSLSPLTTATDLQTVLALLPSLVARVRGTV